MCKNLVKETLKQKMDELKSNYEEQFIIESNLNNGKTFVYKTPNGIEVIFTLKSNVSSHNPSYFINEGIYFEGSVIGSNQTFDILFDSRTFESKNYSRYGGDTIIPQLYFRINTEETLLDLTNELKTVYWFNTDISFIENYVDSILSKQTLDLFPLFYNLMSEYLVTLNEYENYESILLQNWKKEVHLNGKFSINKRYQWRVKEDISDTLISFRINESEPSIRDVFYSTYMSGSYTKGGIYKNVNFLKECKKGKYVVGYVNDFSLPINSSNFTELYYFSKNGLDKFLNEVYYTNSITEENHSFDNIINEIKDGGLIDIKFENIEPNINYKLEKDINFDFNEMYISNGEVV